MPIAQEDHAGHRAFYRQGHPQNARDLLAGDAAGRGTADLSPSERSRMDELWRRAHLQKFGNIPDPLEYQKKYGPDVLRFFLLREAAYGLDVDFTEERLIERYNSELANDREPDQPRALDGPELFSRSSSVGASFGRGLGRSQDRWGTAPAEMGEIDSRIEKPAIQHRSLADLDNDRRRQRIYSQNCSFHTGQRPRQARLEWRRFWRTCLECLRVIADVLEPFMPVTSARMFEMLAVH